MAEEATMLVAGLVVLVFFGATLYSSSNELKTNTDTKKQDKLPEVKTGTYSVSPFEQICSECKLNQLKDADASQFTTSKTVPRGEFPICYDYNKTHKKCCTVKKDDVYFGCPKFCFDNVKHSLDKSTTYSESELKIIMRENKYCNTL